MIDESILKPRKRRVPANALTMPLLWLGGVLVCTVITLFLNAGPVQTAILVVALIGAMPALLSLIVSPFLDEDWAQAIVVIAWTSLAGLAIAAVGSMSTPFVVLFIMPVVAAHSLGGPRLTMEAAALTMLAVALLVAMEVGGLLTSAVINTSSVELIGPLSVILTLIASSSALVVHRQGGWDAHSSRLRLMRYALDAVVCLDGRGRNLAASPEARRILGGARRIGSVLSVPHRTRLETALARVLRSGESEDVEVDVPVPGKEESRRYELRLVRDHGRAVMVYLRDVTERAIREDRLVAERDEALSAARQKSQFLAGISHELRTPLNAIIGFSDMMKARLFGPLPAKYAEYADLIYDSGRHLVDLVGDVLDMSKIEADHYTLRKTGFDARELISSSVKLMTLGAEEVGVKLKTQLPNTAVAVSADRKALRQILLNLLSNAIKFTPAEGTVTVKLGTQDNSVLIAVSDNGVGMTPQDAARLGRPYQQAASAQITDARGTGLGMALVKSLAELHEGTMSVQSELGVGTTVCVRLPIRDGAALGLGELAHMDVRDHIRRAQNASDEIAKSTKKIANG